VTMAYNTYACVWSEVLDWDLASGYGYDLAWVDLCAEDRAAIIHATKVSQLNLKTVSML